MAAQLRYNAIPGIIVDPGGWGHAKPAQLIEINYPDADCSGFDLTEDGGTAYKFRISRATCTVIVDGFVLDELDLLDNWRLEVKLENGKQTFRLENRKTCLLALPSSPTVKKSTSSNDHTTVATEQSLVIECPKTLSITSTPLTKSDSITTPP